MRELNPALNEMRRVLERIGLSTTEAITLFMHQVVIHKGIPFLFVFQTKKQLPHLENFSGYKGYSIQRKLSMSCGDQTDNLHA